MAATSFVPTPIQSTPKQHIGKKSINSEQSTPDNSVSDQQQGSGTNSITENNSSQNKSDTKENRRLSDKSQRSHNTRDRSGTQSSTGATGSISGSGSNRSLPILDDHFSETDGDVTNSTVSSEGNELLKSVETLKDDSEDAIDSRGLLNSEFTQTSLSSHSYMEAPIVGYEIMEQRAKFTVFKVNVRSGPFENWFIFRRYTDFVRLNDKLKVLFPAFRLSLPPKRWFSDNFDLNFLDDRILGLQAFMNNTLGHKDVSACEPVREFYCMEDPPGPHDSLEESRALCESLEETVYNLRKDLQERDSKIELQQEELSLLRSELDSMRRLVGNRQSSPGSMYSISSIADCDSHSCTEADIVNHASKESNSSSKLTNGDIDPFCQSTDSVLEVNNDTFTQSTNLMLKKSNKT